MHLAPAAPTLPPMPAISMMPEGLLKSFSNEEVRDLLAYLRTTRQVPLP